MNPVARFATVALLGFAVGCGPAAPTKTSSKKPKKRPTVAVASSDRQSATNPHTFKVPDPDQPFQFKVPPITEEAPAAPEPSESASVPAPSPAAVPPASSPNLVPPEFRPDAGDPSGVSQAEVPLILSLAVFNSADVYGARPKNYVDASGRPLLSWRIQILPFMEQKNLFEEFQLKEAWDSDANKPLLAKAPRWLRTAYSEGEYTTTWKMVPGAAGGILLVEGGPGSSVPWTQPDEVVIDPDMPLAAFGQEPEGGYRVVLADGSRAKLDAKALSAKLLGKE